MRARNGSWLATAVALSIAAAACASGGGGGAGATIEDAYGARSPEAAVGQFLDAAKRNDYALMARLFGNTEGPAIERMGRVDVEQRMFVLASILRHESYSLRPMGVAEAEGKRRVIAEMVGTRNGNATVPFVAASSRGRWFVEQIMTENLSGGR